MSQWKIYSVVTGTAFSNRTDLVDSIQDTRQSSGSLSLSIQIIGIELHCDVDNLAHVRENSHLNFGAVPYTRHMCF